MKAILLIVVTVVLVGVAVFAFNSSSDEMPRAEREALVGAHIQEHISDLSPESEVLGGTFYVTNIVFTGEKTGEVSYEDGHIALVANFTYDIKRDGTVEVTLSDVREAGE